MHSNNPKPSHILECLTAIGGVDSRGPQHSLYPTETNLTQLWHQANSVSLKLIPKTSKKVAYQTQINTQILFCFPMYAHTSLILRYSTTTTITIH